MAKATVLLFLLLTVFSPAIAKRMRWIPNVDLNNPDNWDPKGSPCRNDHVRFPVKAPPVYIQTNQTLVELVLPNDGEIILSEGSALTFPETPDSSCIGKNVLFTGVTPKSWFDPVNWCVTSESSADCLTIQPDLLDTERIPCLSDDAVFVAGTSFFVDLQSAAEIRVASLRLGSEQMNTETFRSYRDSESGRKRFIGQNNSMATPTTVTIGGPACTDVTGCICGNLRSSSLVCVDQSNRCAHVSCRSPILADGHCCHICGAVLSLDYGTGFKLNNLRNLITDTFRRLSVDPESVKTILSKMDNDRIQVVLESKTDDGGGGGGDGAAQVGRSLKEDLEKDHRYGAVRVTLILSEGGSPEAHTGDGDSSRMSSGAIVGLLFAVLLVVIALLAAAYFYRNRATCNRPKFPELSFPSAPNIRRFFRRNSDGENAAEMELRHQSVSFDNRIYEGHLSGFENPTYGDIFTGLQSDSPTRSMGQEKGGFSNPTYATMEPPVESKDSAPPDYILYDVPPKEPSRKEPRTKKQPPETDQTLKGEQRKAGSGAKDGSDEPQRTSDSLSKVLMSPFRAVTSRLRRTRLEEEEDVTPEQKGEGPKEDEETEADKKRARVKFGRAKDHERLEETGEGGDGGEEDGRRVEKRGGKEAGFGNPLYGGEDDPGGEVVERDLGEAGTTGSYASVDRTQRGKRAGFENPLFQDSGEKLPKADTTRSVSIAGVTEVDDESTA